MTSSGLPPLYLISDAERVGAERFLAAAAAAVEAGLRWVQVREPGWSDEQIRGLVRRLRERLPDDLNARLEIVVNGRPEVAKDLGLAGVHLGRCAPTEVGPVKLYLGPRFRVGYSAHSPDDVLSCAGEGADYVSYSPVFGATSKRHPLPSLGLEGLESVCKLAPIAVYALGGIRPEHAADLRHAGAAGAAMIGSIIDAEDPGGAVSEFLKAWESARPRSR